MWHNILLYDLEHHFEVQFFTPLSKSVQNLLRQIDSFDRLFLISPSLRISGDHDIGEALRRRNRTHAVKKRSHILLIGLKRLLCADVNRLKKGAAHILRFRIESTGEPTKKTRQQRERITFVPAKDEKPPAIKVIIRVNARLSMLIDNASGRELNASHLIDLDL